MRFRHPYIKSFSGPWIIQYDTPGEGLRVHREGFQKRCPLWEIHIVKIIIIWSPSFIAASARSHKEKNFNCSHLQHEALQKRNPSSDHAHYLKLAMRLLTLITPQPCYPEIQWGGTLQYLVQSKFDLSFWPSYRWPLVIFSKDTFIHPLTAVTKNYCMSAP